MEGAITKAIKKYCKHTNSVFIGHSYGYYDFKNENGKVVSLRQKDLLRMTREFED